MGVKGELNYSGQCCFQLDCGGEPIWKHGLPLLRHGTGPISNLHELEKPVKAMSCRRYQSNDLVDSRLD